MGGGSSELPAVVKEEEDDMKATLETMNITKIDQHQMNPTFLSGLLNAIPHVDFDFETIESDIFDPRSTEYRHSLLIIGLVPVIAAGLALLGLYAYTKWRQHNRRLKVKRLCECFLYKLWYICAVLLALVLVMEIMLHITILWNLRPLTLEVTYVMRDYQIKCIQKVMAATSNLEPYHRFGSYYYDVDAIEDMYEIYKQAVFKILRAIDRIKEPQLEPHKVNSPLRQYIAVYEWIRFIFFGLAWTVILFTVIWYRRRQLMQRDSDITNAKCSLCGLIFCALAVMVLLITMVSLSDICQYPNYAVTGTRPKKMTKNFLRTQYDHFCQMFRYEMSKSMKNFVRTYRDAKRTVLREIVAKADIVDYKINAKEIQENWPMGASKEPTTYKYRVWYADELYQKFGAIYTAQYQKKVIDWDENMECAQQLKYVNQPEDPTPLCQGDKVLIWIIMQFFMMVIVTVLFFVILATYVSKIELPPPEKGKIFRF